MHEIKCGEIWGGVRGADIEAVTSSVQASLFASVHQGAKGGDIYYFSVCNNDLLTRIAVADVAGHGEAVAHISEWMYASLAQRMNDTDSHEVLADLNLLALEYGYKAITTAAVCGFFRNTNELFFSYAGHHPVLIRSQESGKWKRAELPETQSAANLPLGVDNDSPYDQSVLPLQSGDLLFLYTDGLVEARSVSREPFGEERLMNVLNAVDGDFRRVKRTVLEALTQYTEGGAMHDDVTIMAVQIK